jgi:hypothetical protein
MVLPVLMALWRGTPEAATAYGAGR